MTTTQTRNRIPAPLYAAAGAGDLAYQKLRDLQAKVIELRARRGADLDIDVERLRVVARRQTAAFVAGAQAAQEKAVALYNDLVSRGEKVVGGGARTAESRAAQIAATAEADAKPAKRTRPAASTTE